MATYTGHTAINLVMKLRYGISKNILTVVLSASAICLMMMLDNNMEITYALSGELSIFYLLFCSIIYGGTFGPYFSSILCVIPFLSSLHNTNSRCSKCQIGRIEFFVKKVMVSGGTLSLGYLLFVMILLPFTSFTNSQDMASGLYTFPYFVLSLNGFTVLHIVVVVLYGFLKGAIWGALCITVSAFTKNKSILLFVPFIGKITLMQIYRLIWIEEGYRLDFWLSMTYILQNEIITVCLSIMRSFLLVMFCGIIYIHSYKERKRS
ncbi:hypothetical protein [Beduinella massiliensis]|uniref:hypothetical protein n=1 Tax=Beduinella massiliensis TaxID=1852363 RepID=UPI0031FA4082